MRIRIHALHCALCLVPSALIGCATPATEIKVETMSVKQALEQSRQTSSNASIQPIQAQLTRPLVVSTRPVPIVSPPDVRFAWITPYVDSERNQHFGSWVAIAVRPFMWVDPIAPPTPIAYEPGERPALKSQPRISDVPR